MTTKWRDLPTFTDVAAAIVEKDEIQMHNGDAWIPWLGEVWSNRMNFRARSRRPNTRSVTMFCWFDGTSLIWRAKDHPIGLNHWVHIPSEDKKIEVKE